MGELIGRSEQQIGHTPHEAYLASTAAYAATNPSFQHAALAATQAAGVDNMNNLVAMYARFDHPSVSTVDGTTHIVQHHVLHQLLRVIPSYIEQATAAGLTPNQASGLVGVLLSAEERSEWSVADPPVVYLGEALELQAQTHGPLTIEDYEQVQGLIAETASREDDNASALDTYRALSRLGMTTAESIDFIRTDLQTDSLLMNPMLEVLNALSIAEVSTSTLTEICQQLIGNNENPRDLAEIQGDLGLLRECVVTVAPGQDIHPDDLLTAIHTQLAQGRDMSDIVNSFLSAKQLRQAPGVLSVYRPSDRIGQHFLSHEGQLELSPLPYRTERSFDDGIRDLSKIALHRPKYREAVGEGFWVFAPDATTPTWYSLGGETEVRVGRVAHHYPEYPLSELSRNPSLVHCHPFELERMISPDRDNSLYPNEALPVVERFLAATPSRRDYQMVAELLKSSGGPQEVRSLFVHGSGVTEYTFPQDPAALENMAQVSQKLRDDLLRVVDWNRILYDRRLAGLVRGPRRENDVAVGYLVRLFDEAMPKGFGLRMLNIGGSLEFEGAS